MKKYNLHSSVSTLISLYKKTKMIKKYYTKKYYSKKYYTKKYYTKKYYVMHRLEIRCYIT